MRDRIRAIVEDLLPWFDRRTAGAHDVVTETIRKRSIAARVRAEQVIAEYRLAEAASARAGDKLVAEIRRSDERR